MDIYNALYNRLDLHPSGWGLIINLDSDAIKQSRTVLHPARDWLEVVQVALLMSGGQLAEQGAAAVHQVRPGLVEISWHHKELLLPTQVALHGLRGALPFMSSVF